MKVKPDGFRKDTKQLFSQFTLTEPIDKSQTAPFIVVDKTIHKVKTVDELLNYDDGVEVFQTWPGKKRSDIFYFTVGALRRHIQGA